MAKESKNGLSNRVVLIVVGVIVAGAITAVIAFGPSIQDNAHAAEVNKTDIIRVDKKVDVLIMKQEKFITDTTKAVGAIETSVAVIKTQLKAHNEHHNP